jgi:hypothetical protein
MGLFIYGSFKDTISISDSNDQVKENEQYM